MTNTQATEILLHCQRLGFSCDCCAGSDDNWKARIVTNEGDVLRSDNYENLKIDLDSFED